MSFSSSASFGATVTTGMALVTSAKRAVLELAGGVGLGVDVADFLELERAFQGDGVVQAAAEKERVIHAGKVLGPAHHLRLQRQHGLQRQPAGGAWP